MAVISAVGLLYALLLTDPHYIRACFNLSCDGAVTGTCLQNIFIYGTVHKMYIGLNTQNDQISISAFSINQSIGIF